MVHFTSSGPLFHGPLKLVNEVIRGKIYTLIVAYTLATFSVGHNSHVCDEYITYIILAL